MRWAHCCENQNNHGLGEVNARAHAHFTASANMRKLKQVAAEQCHVTVKIIKKTSVYDDMQHIITDLR